MLGVGLLALAAPLYLIPNHYPLYKPWLLPLTWVDRVMPFIPGTIWVYLSDYPFLISAFMLVRNQQNLRRFVFAILAVQILSVLIFVAFPTAYPRELFPLPASMDSASRYLFELQRANDTPNNCFPSLHVSGVFTALFLFRDENQKLRLFYLVWAVAIAISTMTTKQHYFADVLGGYVLAWICDRFARRRLG